jgi:hypothetical protein
MHEYLSPDYCLFFFFSKDTTAPKAKAPAQTSKPAQSKETSGDKSSLGISFKKDSSTFGDWYQDVNSLSHQRHYILTCKI